MGFFEGWCSALVKCHDLLEVFLYGLSSSGCLCLIMDAVVSCNNWFFNWEIMTYEFISNGLIFLCSSQRNFWRTIPWEETKRDGKSGKIETLSSYVFYDTFQITDGKCFYGSAVLVFVVYNTGKRLMEGKHESPRSIWSYQQGHHFTLCSASCLLQRVRDTYTCPPTPPLAFPAPLNCMTQFINFSYWLFGREELRRWFLSMETTLFRYRFLLETSDAQVWY